MNLFDAQTQRVDLIDRLSSYSGLVVACYCAAWCDTCNQYRPAFESLAARKPEQLFVWIDIEESEELLDDLDVENFPTILIQSETGNHFFGTMLPHVEHLERLLAGLEGSTDVVEDGPGPLKELLGN